MLPSIQNITKIRTLLVDDELANLRLLIEFLQNQELMIMVAQNGSEGLHIAKHAQPELILLDVRMPDMDGFTFHRRLLEHSTMTQALVIFISAIDDINYEEYALSIGGADYITKPINGRKLIARIFSHLGRQRQHRTALTRLADYERYVGLDKSTFNKSENLDANDNKIHIISEYLLNNLQTTPSLNDLARIANTNRTTINMQFRQSFGKSIFEWLAEQRLLRAAVLLRTSTMLIQDIADTVGYANTAALTHAFKRRFECTPREYRLIDSSQI